MRFLKTYSLFRLPDYKWYCVKKRVRSAWNSVKGIFWRARFGFCPMDTFDLDRFYATVFINTLNYFKAHLHSYPEEIGLDEYNKKLQEIINGFEMYLDDSFHRDTLIGQKEMMEAGRKALDTSFKNLRELFEDLWD